MVNKIPSNDKGMKENKLIVVVPTYNAELYIEKCLESILNQDYDNYEVIVIDDCSTDNTQSIINRVGEKYSNGFTVHRNTERVGSPLAAFIKGIELISRDDEDIIITVDGDDWLAGARVLSYINKVYQDENIYMTYGQYEPLSGTYHNYCKPIPNTQKYRESGKWLASHLRTVKRKLFNKIDKNDLKDTNGEYYKCAGDAAYMYPIIEMAGHKHIKFIEEVLYIYNDNNPLNEMKSDLNVHISIVNEIKSKKVYNEIETL